MGVYQLGTIVIIAVFGALLFAHARHRALRADGVSERRAIWWWTAAVFVGAVLVALLDPWGID